jgi:hypothetical protein
MTGTCCGVSTTPVFASGKLAALAGKTFKWVVKPIGFNRFDLEYQD